jgi:flagellar biosynthesis protein FlhB
MDDVERTLPATERRRAWAREQGYSARSAAFTAAMSLMTAAALWLWSGPAVIDRLASRLQDRLSRPAAVSLTLDSATDLVREDLMALGLFGLWGMATVWVVAVVANLAQAGFHWSPAAVSADAARINPAAGLSRFFSVSNVLTSFWSLLVLGGVSVGAFVALSTWKPIEATWGGRFETLIGQASNDMAMTAMQLGGLVVALCILDIARRRWALEQSLRMTADEHCEEAGKTPVTRRRATAGRS